MNTYNLYDLVTIKKDDKLYLGYISNIQYYLFGIFKSYIVNTLLNKDLGIDLSLEETLENKNIHVNENDFISPSKFIYEYSKHIGNKVQLKTDIDLLLKNLKEQKNNRLNIIDQLTLFYLVLNSLE